MRIINLAILTVIIVAPAAAAQDRDNCRHEAIRSANIDASGANLLVVDAGSGSLKIEGKPGLTRVVIRGRACASDEDLLDDIKLEAKRDGNSVVVRANVRDDKDDFHFRSRMYERLDVVMEVPAGIAANIDDGSGEIELSHLGDVDIDDGSGSIVGSDLGAVRLDDGSGEIDLSDVRGRLDIEDGSGEITLRNIAGAIDINDGSGEITVRVARSNVRISDSSGGISVMDVGGDFVVTDDGSGGIDYDNVRGRVDIPRKKR
jgi:hypothetical protein